jgi:hypothetical protein
MTTDGPRDPVHRAVLEWWPNLPLLLVASIPVAAGWAALRAAAAGWGSLLLLGAGLVVVPLFAGLLHSCTQLLSDEHVGVLQLARRMPGILTCAWRVTVPITSVALLAGAAGAAWQRGGQPWMLVSLGMCVAVLAVVVVVGVMALPYSLRSNGGAREVWLVGAFLATRHPVLVLGVLSACILTVWVAAHLSFALLVLVPAPLALIWAAAASEASLRGRARLEQRTRQPV